MATVAPPGCRNVILGVNVYPEPDPVNSTAVTEPFCTVAFSVACVEPVFVGDSI